MAAEAFLLPNVQFVSTGFAEEIAKVGCPKQ